MQPNIQAFFDPVTWTVSYVVFDKPGGHCAIIDPVLDYDPKSGRTKHHSADVLIKFVHSKELTVDWILETHAHADHLSSAHYLQQELGGKVAIGSRISGVQQVFKKLFNMGPDFQPDGSQFDHLFDDGDTFEVGELKGRAIFVPGHTPADMAYQFGDAIFIGDTMFMPDVGTARADFPGGDARQLYRSIRKLLDQYPPETRLFMCHDYPPGDRPIQWESTVAEQRAHNIHVHDGINEDGFVAMRTARDATLEMPVLILPSVQVNVRAGQMPPAEDNGRVYLKIPINVL
ncbi:MULTISPECIES: MBL fold metallo-hydrolase [Nitrosomonas]|uniref:Metallo-beta-lactamase superfamily n=1 Tax=Nitrosomonas europaea (strain ATCC 19718 / CIP 103999 / KCTC 2705 / NBRC 14298) TaxID=228410 RepID=Q82RZ4_NITEU|nr:MULTISPECIES: MBL fold metallo-hydrolase [Nitrosomonas]KXK45128.1 MAG: metallo-beta-lactamase superfamily protein [Nitrosomonas europaea]MBV6389356.1 putative metallo-hydrolase [Nitrosomonas europaea]QOJ10459.1 MAG: MBL fold metallo-hydrolase [Nitrosomonas sp. H1_AOB3]CAD86483.1 Metallo-beta-lactamase superfamily [Nitrosomonas europaea ATCC 19718]SDV99548.1 Glyoxylase, beta-lactamase superfamily II [Nitrosomonas europaea]